MNYYHTGSYRRRPAIAQSAFMCTEEIHRQREMSGWNPYVGEEETDWMENNERQPLPESAVMRERQPLPESAVMGERQPLPESAVMGERQPLPESAVMGERQPLPYFQRPEYTQILEDARGEERDFRALQAMYPEAAKRLMPYIEEECDQMEYEGSMMFDEYPDPVSVQRIGQRIWEQTRNQFPEETGGAEEMPEEIFSMQHPGPGRNRPGKNWLGDLIQVMLLQEMHHRRCRHHRCRKIL